MVSQFFQVKIRAFDSCTQRRNDNTDLFALQNSVEPGFLNIQDFSFKGQYRLEPAIPRLFCRSACRIPFNKEYLAP